MTQRQPPPLPAQESSLGTRQRTNRSAVQHSRNTMTAEQGREVPPGAIDLWRGREFEEQMLTPSSYDLYGEGEDGYSDSWPGRLPSSSRRYLAQAGPDGRSQRVRVAVHETLGQQRHSIPPRRTATQTNIPAVQGNRQRAPSTEDEQTPRRTSSLVAPKRRVHFHWLVFVGLAMFIMIIGWLAFNALSSWYAVTTDDWRYGRPRTFQIDEVVGHNHDGPAKPSHFIALNLNGRIEVIEFPAGDGSKAKIYSGPQLYGTGNTLVPVWISFQDEHGGGKSTMLVHFQDTVLVYDNVNGTFVPRPSQ